MAFWPISVATNADLYIAVNSLQTTLGIALGLGDVTVTVASASGFPTAGAVTIGNEVIFYTNISGNQFTGCTRGSDGTTAATHSVGVPVGATIIAYHHNGLKNEIIAVESFLDTHLGKSTAVTAVEFEYLSGVSSAIQTQLNAKATNSLVVHLAGAESITGAKTFDSSTFLMKETGGGTDTITLATPSLAASRVYTFPDAGAAADVVVTAGSQTLTGTKTFNDFRGTFGADIAAGSHKITGLAAATANGDAVRFEQNKLIQRAYSSTVAATTGTTTVPEDDTKPQSTEGDQYLSITITPTNASNILRFHVCVPVSNSAAGSMAMSLFQDAAASALATVFDRIPAGVGLTMNLYYEMTAGTTSSTTFKIRVGNSSAGTTQINSANASGREYGGASVASIAVEEVTP